MMVLFFRKNGDAVEATTIEGELVLRWPLADKYCFTRYIMERNFGVSASMLAQGGFVVDVDIKALDNLPPGWRPLRPSLWQRIKNFFNQGE